MDRSKSSALRNFCRGGAVGAFLLVLLSGAFFSTASADTPVGWEKVEPVSFLSYFMLLVVWPIGIALLLSLLTLLPSLARRGSTN